MSGLKDPLVDFRPTYMAWDSYPPKKTLLPSDDYIEAPAFEFNPDNLQNEFGRPPFAFQAAGVKNKTRKDKRKKDKRKKYKTKKKKKSLKS